MGHLNDSDRAYLRELRDKKILLDIDSHLLDQKDGVIMIACADGDQMPDVFEKQEEYLLEQRETPRIHTLALNGGAIVVPADSPLNSELPKGRVIIDDIKGAMMLKGIRTIVLYAHAPCGAAGLYHLNTEEVINFLIRAKEEIKTAVADIKVACFFHVDWGDHKRTYFVSAAKWRKERYLIDS
ncbi:MAG: hypothetical protein HY980_04555 [Candidatus Magasanikbacteria bacterium]|nr:hypothetical protein [Candidatus Magasanikbacteria bacterium]